MTIKTRLNALERQAPESDGPTRIQVYYARKDDPLDPGRLEYEIIVYPDGTTERIIADPADPDPGLTP